jgi:signal transduction histidine kinase
VSTAKAETRPQSSNVAHGDFLQAMAHDLRGPVGVVVGALDELEIELGPQPERVHNYVLMARRGAQRVLQAAERLQRAALLERGAVEWAMTPVDLRRLAHVATQSSETAESRRGVRVLLLEHEHECTTTADTDWLLVAMTEVIGNAIRFATSHVSVRTSMDDERVMLTVMDDGPAFDATANGIAAATGLRGAGRSLPLVQHVLEAHQGHLHVTAAAGLRSGGEGACIVMALPRLNGVAK